MVGQDLNTGTLTWVILLDQYASNKETRKYELLEKNGTLYTSYASFRILQRNRPNRVDIDIYKEDIYYRNWLKPLQSLRGPMVCSDLNISSGQNLKAWEPRTQILQSRRRWMLSSRGERICPSSAFLLQWGHWMMPIHIAKGRPSLLILLIQILISSLNTQK